MRKATIKQLQAMGFKVRRGRKIVSTRNRWHVAYLAEEGRWYAHVGREQVMFRDPVSAATWITIEASNQ